MNFNNIECLTNNPKMTLIITHNPFQFIEDNFKNIIDTNFDISNEINNYEKKQITYEKTKINMKFLTTMDENDWIRKNKIENIKYDKRKQINTKEFLNYNNIDHINKSLIIGYENIDYEIYKNMINTNDFYKTLLLQGIGIYSPNNMKDEKYNEYMRDLLNSNQLSFIIGDRTTCFGLNFGFERVIIADDFGNNFSNKTIFQGIGRTGRIGLTSNTTKISCVINKETFNKLIDYDEFIEEHTINLLLNNPNYFINKPFDETFNYINDFKIEKNDWNKIETKKIKNILNINEELQKYICDNQSINNNYYIIKNLNDYEQLIFSIDNINDLYKINENYIKYKRNEYFLKKDSNYIIEENENKLYKKNIKFIGDNYINYFLDNKLIITSEIKKIENKYVMSEKIKTEIINKEKIYLNSIKKKLKTLKRNELFNNFDIDFILTNLKISEITDQKSQILANQINTEIQNKNVLLEKTTLSNISILTNEIIEFRIFGYLKLIDIYMDKNNNEKIELIISIIKFLNSINNTIGDYFINSYNKIKCSSILINILIEKNLIFRENITIENILLNDIKLLENTRFDDSLLENNFKLRDHQLHFINFMKDILLNDNSAFMFYTSSMNSGKTFISIMGIGSIIKYNEDLTNEYLIIYCCNSIDVMINCGEYANIIGLNFGYIYYDSDKEDKIKYSIHLNDTYQSLIKEEYKINEMLKKTPNDINLINKLKIIKNNILFELSKIHLLIGTSKSVYTFIQNNKLNKKIILIFDEITIGCDNLQQNNCVLDNTVKLLKNLPPITIFLSATMLNFNIIMMNEQINILDHYKKIYDNLIIQNFSTIDIYNNCDLLLSNKNNDELIYYLPHYNCENSIDLLYIIDLIEKYPILGTFYTPKIFYNLLQHFKNNNIIYNTNINKLIDINHIFDNINILMPNNYKKGAMLLLKELIKNQNDEIIKKICSL